MDHWLNHGANSVVGITSVMVTERIWTKELAL